MKVYLVLMPRLPNGNHVTYSTTKWHERLRLALAKRLLLSVKLNNMFSQSTVANLCEVSWQEVSWQ